jgi:hypothetical protein
MAGKALVVGANILIRAVLGQRVRQLIEAYAKPVSFYVPDSAFEEAEEHLPALATRHKGDPHKSWRFSAPSRLSSKSLEATYMLPSRWTRGNDSAIAIRTTGPCWRPPSRLVARSGRRTRISSAVEFQL